QYVFNTPWAMKAFDGREKSLLRAATLDVLPQSVAQRVKSPYPSTQDPRYAEGLRIELKQLLDDADSPALSLVNMAAARAAADSGGERVRSSAELVLCLDAWRRAYDTELSL